MSVMCGKCQRMATTPQIVMLRCRRDVLLKANMSLEVMKRILKTLM